MAVVRELVTKLSFKVDKRGVENFNKTILGFKSRLAIATTAVSGFVGAFLKTASAISNSIITTDNLAKSIGIAGERLIAFERVAARLQLPGEEFRSGLARVVDLVDQARVGQGELFRLAQEGGFEIRDAFGNILPTEEIVKNIFDALRTVDSERNQRLLTKMIFGSPNFANLLELRRDELDRLIETEKLTAEEYKNATKQAKRFDSALETLSGRFKDFIQRFAPPVLQATATGLEAVDEFIQPRIVEDTRRRISEENKEFLQDFKKEFNKKSPEAQQRFLQRQSQSRNIDVRNTVNVTVPPGTEENQRQFIEQATQESFDALFDNKMEQIGNDFPESE